MKDAAKVAQERLVWWRRLGLNVDGGVLLEIGCGDGGEAMEFSRHFKEVRTIDANGMVNHNLHDIANVRPFHGTVPRNHDCPPGADILLCTNVVEHIDPACLPEFVQECHDLLRPGGTAFFAWAPVWSNVGAHIGGRRSSWEHILLSGADWLAWLDEQHGLRETWAGMEWRPGLKRADWLTRNEQHTTLTDFRAFLLRAGFEVLNHNMRMMRERDLFEHPQRAQLEALAHVHDLTCHSDTWLCRRNG